MNGDKKNSAPPLVCTDCRRDLQDYLDGTMAKEQSLRLFLHLRECDACQAEHDRLQHLFGLLDSLPAQEVPADFDDAILAAIPYNAYREMEAIRRERVPVFLAEESLPAFVRSRTVRTVGLGAAAAAAAAVWYLDAGAVFALLGVAGILPEALVRLQNLGRRALLAVRRVES